MDVLKACGADLPENFRRHDARGRFMPVQLVDHDVDRMGDEMACCLAPGGEDYEHPLAAPHNLAWYVFTKTANIARPHSRGFDYAKLVVDTRASMQQLEASKGKDADARARVMANWDRVEEMKKTFPEFSINWSAIFRAPEPGKDSKRVMGLHPDAPLSGRVLKELREAGLE